MPNPWRGEMQATFSGKPYRLCLTLGALAELEQALGGEDVIAFTKRLSEGHIRASDVMHVLGCGLRGGGHEISDQELAQMMPSGGFGEAMQIVAQLIALSFGGREATALEKSGKNRGLTNP